MLSPLRVHCRRTVQSIPRFKQPAARPSRLPRLIRRHADPPTSSGDTVLAVSTFEVRFIQKGRSVREGARPHISPAHARADRRPTRYPSQHYEMTKARPHRHAIRCQLGGRGRPGAQAQMPDADRRVPEGRGYSAGEGARADARFQIAAGAG